VSEAALLGDLSNSVGASRFVVIASGADDLSRLWQAGFPTVLSNRDSPTVAYLAILAAELRLNAKRLETAWPASRQGVNCTGL
jgi:hypothetical protein